MKTGLRLEWKRKQLGAKSCCLREGQFRLSSIWPMESNITVFVMKTKPLFPSSRSEPLTLVSVSQIIMRPSMVGSNNPGRSGIDTDVGRTPR